MSASIWYHISLYALLNPFQSKYLHANIDLTKNVLHNHILIIVSRVHVSLR